MHHFCSVASRGLILAVAIFLTGGPASAAIYYIEGTFSATFSGAPDIDSGSFSATVDGSGLSGSGFEYMTISPDTFTMDPSTYGSTMFTTANVEIDIIFEDGDFSSLIIGGDPSGASVVLGSADDFSVTYYFNVLDGNASLATGSDGEGNQFAANSVGGSVSAESVPEPAAATLLATAFGLLALRRRRGRA